MKQFLVSLCVLVTSFSACTAGEDKLTAEQAKDLLPEAAGISNADLKALAENPRPDTVKSSTLSLVLLNLDPRIAAKNPEAPKEFRYLAEGPPNPAAIVSAMLLSKDKGYGSFIQPAYITDCTCESTAERAEGVVTFKSKQFAGRIPFVAQATKQGWVITEFRLPQHGVKVVRGKDGLWKSEALPER
jgi:hypothetical protein